MMLLTPLLLGAVFGSTFLRGQNNLPEPARPLIASGGILLVLFGMLQLMANQFGFDRDGFRVFVLCAASRRDILFGKNLSFAPLALGLAALLLGAFLVLAEPSGAQTPPSALKSAAMRYQSLGTPTATPMSR